MEHPIVYKPRRKLLAPMLCLTVMACTLSACTISATPNDGTQTGESATMQSNIQISETAQNMATLTELLIPVKLPNEYLITYEILENGKVFTVTKGQDSEGHIYFCSGEEELLFVPVSNGRYQLYRPTADGVFTLTGNNRYTANYVETATAEFMDYAQQSASRFNGVSALAGTEVVAGRLCDLYCFDVTILNFTNQYSLAVDQETGACMLWQKSTGVNGLTINEEGSFQCTAFLNENVEFPISK